MRGKQGIEIFGIDGALGRIDVERRADARIQLGGSDVGVGFAHPGLD